MSTAEGRTIFWRNEQVDIIDGLVRAEDFTISDNLKYLYCPCVWNAHTYGHFAQDEQFNIFWQYQVKDIQCPKEFRLALLLMGITL